MTDLSNITTKLSTQNVTTKQDDFLNLINGFSNNSPSNSEETYDRVAAVFQLSKKILKKVVNDTGKDSDKNLPSNEKPNTPYEGALKPETKIRYAGNVDDGYKSLENTQKEIRASAVRIEEYPSLVGVYDDLKSSAAKLTESKIALRILRDDIKDGSAYSFKNHDGNIMEVGPSKQTIALKPYYKSTREIHALSIKMQIMPAKISIAVEDLRLASEFLADPKKNKTEFIAEFDTKYKARANIEEAKEKIKIIISDINDLSQKMLNEEVIIREVKNKAANINEK